MNVTVLAQVALWEWWPLVPLFLILCAVAYGNDRLKKP